MMNHKSLSCPVCGSTNRHAISPSMTKQRLKAAQSLSSHLSMQFQVPNTKSLIFILGHGNEVNNQEAMTQWVLDRISGVEQWPLSSDEVNNLIDNLEHDLSSILSDLQYGSYYVQ